jgi:multisubunit Na+/H+ antiporter MnhE subunit
MSGWFESGRVADLILLVLLAEAAWLILARRMAPGEVLLALAPGAFLVLALRAALTGADWPYVALPLALSFPVHLADLARRGGRRPG